MSERFRCNRRRVCRTGLEGEEISAYDEQRMQTVRGNRIGMVFQEPMTSLNPVFTIGAQIAEALQRHRELDDAGARAQSLRLLDQVHIPAASERMDQYPHELSGGMKQRVMIAMALACAPQLLIADEPTTALDVTIQAQILDLLGELQRETAIAVLLITHNLGVVAQHAHRAAVMYAGEIVEQAKVGALFETPRHPYTRALLESLPGRVAAGDTLNVITGTVPLPQHYPPGCRFEPRCRDALAHCHGERPPRVVQADYEVRCWLHARHEAAHD